MRATLRETDEENDWILLDETDFEEFQQETAAEEEEEADEGEEARGRNTRLDFVRLDEHRAEELNRAYSFQLFTSAKKVTGDRLGRKHELMALEASDIELIRASWIPARKDPSSSGVLLFKSLFTKFPDYLRFFSQFVDLDIETLHENKKLIRHAVKVIDTVTFVVDSIGDKNKAQQLDEALINLVRSHLKRRIGLKEFRNLGIVIIDFICDLQQRRGSPAWARTSSPCDYASLESKASSEADFLEETSCARCQTYNHTHGNVASDHHANNQTSAGANSVLTAGDMEVLYAQPQSQPSMLDTNLLVAAWTKLYGSILDLVKREGGEFVDEQT